MSLWKKIQNLLNPQKKQPKKQPREVQINIHQLLIENEQERIQKRLKEEMSNYDKKYKLQRLPIENPNLLNEFQKDDQNRTAVFKYIYKKLSPAVIEQRPYVDLFRMGNTLNLARVYKERYNDSLKEMLDHFVKSEEYEYAARVRDLIEHNKKMNG